MFKMTLTSSENELYRISVIFEAICSIEEATTSIQDPVGVATLDSMRPRRRA